MQPPSLPGHQAGEEEVLHQGALSLVVCPQPMQHSLPVRGLLEEGGAASLPGHQAGEEEVLTQQGAATTHGFRSVLTRRSAEESP